MRRKTLVTVVAVCCLLSWSAVLHAQRTQGTISGTVSDSSGAVIHISRPAQNVWSRPTNLDSIQPRLWIREPTR